MIGESKQPSCYQRNLLVTNGIKSAASVNKGSSSANPLHVIIPQKGKLFVSGKVSGLSPQERSSSRGGQNSLHAQVLPLVLINAVKILAFGLSLELELSVTKTSFTSCRFNACCDAQQLTLLQK